MLYISPCRHTSRILQNNHNVTSSSATVDSMSQRITAAAAAAAEPHHTGTERRTKTLRRWLTARDRSDRPQRDDWLSFCWYRVTNHNFVKKKQKKILKDVYYTREYSFNTNKCTFGTNLLENKIISCVHLRNNDRTNSDITEKYS